MPDSGAEFPSLREQHERISKLIGGYTAFVAALLIATVAKSNEYPSAWVVISLLAVSLPSLIALIIVDFVIRVAQRRRASMFRGLAFVLGFLPSLVAMAILIAHFSLIAAVLFILLIAFWFLALYTAAILGNNRESDI